MKLDNLKEEHLVEILKLYEQYCGFGRQFNETMRQRPETVLEHLKKDKREEYRIGSKWDGQSKIYFETDIDGNVAIKFWSNFDPRYRKGKEYEAAEKAGAEFTNAAMQYLTQSN